LLEPGFQEKPPKKPTNEKPLSQCHFLCFSHHTMSLTAFATLATLVVCAQAFNEIPDSSLTDLDFLWGAKTTGRAPVYQMQCMGECCESLGRNITGSGVSPKAHCSRETHSWKCEVADIPRGVRYSRVVCENYNHNDSTMIEGSCSLRFHIADCWEGHPLLVFLFGIWVVVTVTVTVFAGCRVFISNVSNGGLPAHSSPVRRRVSRHASSATKYQGDDSYDQKPQVPKRVTRSMSRNRLPRK
jgi:hypothetical protein